MSAADPDRCTRGVRGTRLSRQPDTVVLLIKHVARPKQNPCTWETRNRDEEPAARSGTGPVTGAKMTCLSFWGTQTPGNQQDRVGEGRRDGSGRQAGAVRRRRPLCLSGCRGDRGPPEGAEEGAVASRGYRGVIFGAREPGSGDGVSGPGSEQHTSVERATSAPPPRPRRAVASTLQRTGGKGKRKADATCVQRHPTECSQRRVGVTGRNT